MSLIEGPKQARAAVPPLRRTGAARRKPKRRRLAVLTFVLLISGVLYGIPTAGADANGIVSDDFGGAQLNERWTVTDPVGDATVAMTGTGAQISLPGGTAHDFSTGTNRAVRLLQISPNTNFTVDAKFDTSVTGSTTAEGIIVEQDVDDFVRFEISTTGCQARLTAGHSSGGNWTTTYNKPLSNGIPQYLRVRRLGNNWSVSYSHDGLGWTTVKTFARSLTVTTVGPYVSNGGSSPPPFDATVDYFVSRSAPLQLEDGAPFEPVPAAPSINLWEGPNQTFGALGHPQPLADVLGRVTDPDGISQLTYTLNGGPNVKLPSGANGTTLHLPGDFKVSAPFANLLSGDNVIAIKAIDTLGNQTVENVVLHYDSGHAWPIPYGIDWSTAPGIPQVAQVVNGSWGVDGDSVRTLIPGYDRLVALGESTWDNYEVTTTVTINADSIVCSGEAVGLLLGWDGYGAPGTPWGAIGWYRKVNQSRWELQILGQKPLARQTLTLENGVPYIFKMQMERTSQSPVQYTYRIKVWPQGQSEPSGWNLTAVDVRGGGSVGLLSHYLDASFGDVSVVPLGR